MNWIKKLTPRKGSKNKKSSKPEEHKLQDLLLHSPNVKKGFRIVRKVVISLSVLVLLVLFYFVILTSTKPKSFIFVTEKIESSLRKNIDHAVKLKNAFIKFTAYGSLQITIEDLRIPYVIENIRDKQFFIIPKLQAEFSLFDLARLRLHPNKIKISNFKLIIDNLDKIQQQSQTETIQTGQANHTALLIEILSSIRNGEFPIKNVEIENAELVLRGKNITTEIFVQNSQIKTAIKRKTLNISSTNKIKFGKESNDVSLDYNCHLSKSDGLKCDFLLDNFVPSSIANLHQNLNYLNRVNSVLKTSASFVVRNGEVENILFKAEAKKGTVELPNVMSQKISFTNFSLEGGYDDRLGVLDLSRIKADFPEITFPEIQDASTIHPHLEMSLLISELKKGSMSKLATMAKSGIPNVQQSAITSSDPIAMKESVPSKPLLSEKAPSEKMPSKKMNFYITLKNVPNDKMEKFWPTSLNDNGVRQWVVEHIKGGMIGSAYAKFSLIYSEEKTELGNMDAQISFSGLNVNYDDNFPPILNASGSANFGINSMKISISDGTVLSSKISDGIVAIDDFSAPTTILKISGRSQGHAADTLKHVDYDSEFANSITKYLNGNSQNSFDIHLPLTENLDLKNMYIAASSVISGLENGYLKGNATINAKKDFGSYDFVNNIDLTAAKITAKSFDVEKEVNIPSSLNFTVSVKDPKKLHIKNISLVKNESGLVTNKQSPTPTSAKQLQQEVATSKISGNLEFETMPFSLASANFKNDNFGKNNYSASYLNNKKGSSHNILITGKRLDFAPFFKKKSSSSSNSSGSFPPNVRFKAAIDNALFPDNKLIKKLSLTLNCDNSFCHTGSINGYYGKNESISLRLVKNFKEMSSNLDGRITNIGHLADVLGVAKIMSGGSTSVRLQNKFINNKNVIGGKITIDDELTVYESETVKRFAKDTLFSKIRDKLFASEKIIFTSTKLDLELQDSLLNIKSLVANNYKIGVTAKGVINLKENSYNIKGMIIPGFMINNLFGIGKIPIIGGLISGVLTGGDADAGLFGLRYEYVKNKQDKEGVLKTSKASAFVPTTISNLFE